MTQPKKPQYRFLEVGEVIQPGDLWSNGTPVCAIIGECVFGYYLGRIVRPVSTSDELTRELLQALEAVVAEYEEGYGLKCIDQVRSAISKAKGLQ